MRQLKRGDNHKQGRGQPEQPSSEGRLAGKDILVRRFELPAGQSFMSVSAITMQATFRRPGSIRSNNAAEGARVTKRDKALRSSPSRCDST